jgi:hypothetical protein
MVFEKVPTFKHLSTDALLLGFFYTFVHKDFIIREIIIRIADQLPNLRQRRILAQLEKDYDRFMESDLVTWANVLMQIDILQSYKTIVTPNEASLIRTSRTKALSESFEGANFLVL